MALGLYIVILFIGIRRVLVICDLLSPDDHLIGAGGIRRPVSISINIAVLCYRIIVIVHLKVERKVSGPFLRSHMPSGKIITRTCRDGRHFRLIIDRDELRGV